MVSALFSMLAVRVLTSWDDMTGLLHWVEVAWSVFAPYCCHWIPNVAVSLGRHVECMWLRLYDVCCLCIQLFSKLQSTKQEIIDLQEANARERQELEQTQNELTRELKLKLVCWVLTEVTAVSLPWISVYLCSLFEVVMTPNTQLWQFVWTFLICEQWRLQGMNPLFELIQNEILYKKQTVIDYCWHHGFSWSRNVNNNQ